MYKSENTMMTPEEELVEILLDFIIASANLAKKVNQTIKIKEGGNDNGQTQQTELVIKDLRNAATTINDVADTMAEMFSTASADEAPAVATPAESTLTLGSEPCLRTSPVRGIPPQFVLCFKSTVQASCLALSLPTTRRSLPMRRR